MYQAPTMYQTPTMYQPPTMYQAPTMYQVPTLSTNHASSAHPLKQNVLRAYPLQKSLAARLTS